MRHLTLAAILCVSLFALTTSLGCAREAETAIKVVDEDLLYQVSTYSALEAGDYDGVITYATLPEHGDLGIGTFDGLDGEMVELDGDFYQIKVDGQVYQVEGTSVAPFAIVTFYKADVEAQTAEGLDYQGLKAYINNLITEPGKIHALKIEGEFAYVKARSVPKQSEPYPPLTEAIKEQAVFEFSQVRGTMVGFWCPAYMQGINVPGYHLHFLTEDKKGGGHVLELRLGAVNIGIDTTPGLWMETP